MKKLYNTKNAMPDDMIDGFVQAYPNIVKKGKNKDTAKHTNFLHKLFFVPHHASPSPPLTWCPYHKKNIAIC